MKPLTVFLHLPKTAGSSFIDCLERNLSCLRFPRGVDPKEGYNKYDCIHGHFNMNHPEIDRCFPGREKIYFTFLREPISRTLSYYYYSEHRGKTLDEWLDASDYFIANTMTKYLGNSVSIAPSLIHLETAIKNLSFINFGITEYFNESLSNFQKAFPRIFKTIKYEKKNITLKSNKLNYI